MRDLSSTSRLAGNSFKACGRLVIVSGVERVTRANGVEVRRPRWHATAVALAVFGLIALTALPAGATRVVRINSKLTISQRAPAFHGKVRSPNGACRMERRVILFRKRFGPDKLLGRAGTDRHGRWSIHVNLRGSGAYYAKVRRRREGTAGTVYVCRADRSRTVFVD